MPTDDESLTPKYEIKYGYNDYTWPTEAKADKLTFDDAYMYIHLRDGRIVMVPLKWIPTLYHAAPELRPNYFLGNDGQSAHWDPEEINEDLRLTDYLGLPKPF